MTGIQSLVDINRASVDELTLISGIGQSLANKIVAARPYQELHDLVKVPGINETKLASLMPYMTVSSPEAQKRSSSKQALRKSEVAQKPVATLGETEAFVFLEDRNERQDALLIIFGGFILGLLLLLLRRKNH